MKLVKLLVHSAPGGAGFALLLAFLVFYLNPELRLRPASLADVWRPLLFSYGLLAAVGWPVAVLALRFFAARPLDLPWFRVRLFHRFHAANLAVAALVWWGNFLATPALLGPAARRLLLAGCGLISLVGILGALISFERVVLPGRARRPAQALLSAALYAGLYVLAAGERLPAPETGPAPRLGEARAERRLILVGVDGLSPDLILPLVAEGRLPSFGRMLREGAWAPVQGFVPTIQASLWTTVATGVSPGRHGIRDSIRYRTAGGRSFGLGPRYVTFRRAARGGLFGVSPVSSADRRAPPAWSILARFGLQAGVVDWPVTSPGDGPAILPVVGERTLSGAAEAETARLADWSAGRGEGATELQDAAAASVTRDLGALGAASRLRAAGGRSLLMTYLPGLDAVQHRFFGEPAAGPGVRGTPVYDDVVARYYRLLDERLAAFLEPAEGPRLVIVVSCFGVDRVPPWTALLRRVLGRPGGEGYHDRAPAGILLAWGDGAAAGRERSAVAPVEVLPTVLYYLGLPVARDMEAPRIDLFSEEFVRALPPSYFSSYDESAGS